MDVPGEFGQTEVFNCLKVVVDHIYQLKEPNFPVHPPRTLKLLEELTHFVTVNPQQSGRISVKPGNGVPLTGLEPVTLGLEIPCSIQLSYRGLRRFDLPQFSPQ